MTDYITVTTQDQIDNLVHRLKSLELEHFRQGALAEESEMLGEDVSVHAQAQDELVKRIDFVRGKLEALGATFAPQDDGPLVVEEPTTVESPLPPSP